MALSDIDRKLLQRCLAREPRAWEDFVDRFLGLVIHVVNHSSRSRSLRLTAEESEDLAAEVFLAIVGGDFAVLRKFRGESSLATYLTVVSRRVVVRELLKRKPVVSLTENGAEPRDHAPSSSEKVGNLDEMEQLLGLLDGDEARVVRMYHLEGRSYQEISRSIGVPENTIGPTLSRARAKMRRAVADTST